MDPLRIPSTTTTSTRSPSPAIPGAWPTTPLHKRSLTCPIPTQANTQSQHVPASATFPEPLHLDRVLNFHQRLSLALSEPDNNSKKQASFTVTPSCPNASPSMPSDDSDLTKYNPNDTSLSVVDTSVATSCTSPVTPERVLIKSLVEPSPSSQMNDNVRIHGPKNRSHATSSEPDNIFSEGSPSNPSASSHGQAVLANSSFSSSPCPSPTSPMVFNSPSPSILPPPRSRTRTNSSQASYDHLSSLSCMTSSEEDFGVVRTREPSRSLSPSPSSHASRYNQALRMPMLYTPERVSPSVEELAPPTIPMLTGLSLPGTPDDSLSIDGNPVLNSFLASPQADVNEPEWTLALSTVTPTNSVSVHDTSPSLSLSPTSSFRAQLNLDAAEHVLSFPSHNPSSAGASVEPSPAIGMSETGSLETSAAEYAAAVMSSVWSSHNPSLDPIVIETTTRVEVSDDNNRHTRSVASDRPARAGSRQSWNKKREILHKVKKFGGRVLQLLTGGAGREERRKELPGPHSAPLMRTPSPPGIPSLDLGDDVRSLERGSSDEGNSRIRRPRPSLTAHTYTPVDTSANTPPPSIRVLPPSAPTSPYTNSGAVPKSESDVVANAQIAMHARPKTLAEIKSGHRFSLSAITRLTRPSSPPSVSSVLISPPRRRRPVSALALPSRRPDSIQFDTQNMSLQDADVPVVRPGRRSTSANLLPPPGLNIPSTRRAPSPEPVAGPSRVRFSLDVETAKKNNRRRFSLSALSTFAAGLKEEGSWARHQPNGY